MLLEGVQPADEEMSPALIGETEAGNRHISEVGREVGPSGSRHLHGKGAEKTQDNSNVVRHRAPLFIAQVDTEKLCVIRDTERILVPNRGARLGNFGVTKISDAESWVIVAEWMQTHFPDYWNCRFCEKFGSNNAVFVAKARLEG